MNDELIYTSLLFEKTQFMKNNFHSSFYNYIKRVFSLKISNIFDDCCLENHSGIPSILLSLKSLHIPNKPELLRSVISCVSFVGFSRVQSCGFSGHGLHICLDPLFSI